MLKFVTVLLYFLHTTKLVIGTIPSYLKMCHTGPNFENCAVANGNAALPELLKGNEDLNIPNMLPLTFPEITADTGNLNVKFNDLQIYGLEMLKLTNFSVDFDKHMMFITLHVDKIEIKSLYDVDGQVLILPIKGNGKCVIELDDTELRYYLKYRLEERNGVEYGMVEPDDELDFSMGNAHFNLENMFNGNKQLGDNVNMFMNEHPQDFIKELSGTIKSTLSSIGRDISRGVIQNIPFQELFIF